jgi:hypothetical protein
MAKSRGLGKGIGGLVKDKGPHPAPPSVEAGPEANPAASLDGYQDKAAGILARLTERPFRAVIKEPEEAIALLERLRSVIVQAAVCAAEGDHRLAERAMAERKSRLAVLCQTPGPAKP